MRALITGVTGQDGHYLVESLASDGVELHGLVRSADDEPAVDASLRSKVVVHDGDLAAIDRLRGVVRDVEPDAIYNLGGISSVGRSWSEPSYAGLVTGVGAVALLEAGLDVNPNLRFIQASSAEIFGAASEVPQREDTPINPVSPYGIAKAYAHRVIQSFRDRGAFASNCILYSHESPRRPLSFVTRKITASVAAIARGEADELSIGNVAARRDWGWAPDYVAAMVAAAHHREPSDFIIATGVSHSVQDFIDAAFDAASVPNSRRKVRTDESELRPQDPAEQRGDPSRAKIELGWTPTVTFEQIVSAMVLHDLETR